MKTSRLNCLFLGLAFLPLTSLLAQQTTLAVVDFEGFGISLSEALPLTNRLRNELFRTGRFEVVERGLMENILVEQDFQMTGCTSNECLAEVGQLLGATQIVGGSISKVGEVFTISARLIDVETGRVLSVSDYDIEGTLGDVLRLGIRQVAIMLSRGNDAPAIFIDQKKPVQVPQRRQPTPVPTPPKKVPSYPGMPFVVRLPFSAVGDKDKEANLICEGTLFLRKRQSLGGFIFAPAISFGFLGRSRPLDSFVEYGDGLIREYNDDLRGYLLVGVHERLYTKLIIGDVFAGIGYGYGSYVKGQITGLGQVDSYKVGDDRFPEPVEWETVYSYGGQLGLRIFSWFVFTEVRYVSTNTYGASSFISLGFEVPFYFYSRQ